MVLKLWLAHHADRILFRPPRTSMRRLYLRSGEGAWRLSASWQLHPEIQGEQEKPWQFGEGLGRFRIWPIYWNFETWMKAILNKDTYHLCSEWIVRLGVQNASKTFYKLKKWLKNAKMPMKLAYLHGEKSVGDIWRSQVMGPHPIIRPLREMQAASRHPNVCAVGFPGDQTSCWQVLWSSSSRKTGALRLA